MLNNLIIGKNSFVGKSLKNILMEFIFLLKKSMMPNSVILRTLFY